MERSTNRLIYKGTIPAAINEARREKKLFVVYVSGDDENSIRLEQTTLTDEKVAEMMNKYCIFVHLIHGDVDAMQFCAIYPQQSIPSISAIGLNGAITWKHDGFIDADNLKKSIEKAWATMHFQETAAALLTAALVSKQPSRAETSAGKVTSSMQPSSRDAASTSADKSSLVENALEEKDSNFHKSNAETHELAHVVLCDTLAKPEEQACPSETVAEISERVIPLKVAGDGALMENMNSSNGSALASSESGPVVQSNVGVSSDMLDKLEEQMSPVETNVEISERLNPVKGAAALVDNMNSGNRVESGSVAQSNIRERIIPAKTNEPETQSSAKVNEVHLSIRLPSGTSLQAKLTKSDTLRAVRAFVDGNQGTGAAPYDLAIPYPRKLFSDEDMNTTLSDLGLASREALIVVPRRQTSHALHFQRQPSSAGYVSQPREESGGYFGLLKTLLSYANPFSYFRGGEPSSSSRSVAANPSPGPYGTNSASTANGSGNARTIQRFGSNIRTLRHNEEEPDVGRDRDVYWNGNSTQFGGDDK